MKYLRERWITWCDGGDVHHIDETMDDGDRAMIADNIIGEDRAELMANAPAMFNALLDIAQNYDCDDDAHRYDTGCRKCMAADAIRSLLKNGEVL